MKLLINDDLIFSETFYPGISDDEWSDYKEKLEEFEDILKSYTVFFTSNINESSYYIHIEAQKVVLDEYDMNNLFFNVLSNFKIKLEYAALGGEGCDFCLKVTKN